MANKSFTESDSLTNVNTTYNHNTTSLKNRRIYKLINGKKLTMTAAVGYCWCNLHKGYINLELLKEHECIDKKCEFFEKFTYHPYWVNKQKLKSERLKGKAEKKHIKETELAILNRIRYLTSSIYGIAISDVFYQDGVYNIKCVSIRTIRMSEYKDIIENEFKVKTRLFFIENSYQFKENLYARIKNIC